MKSIKELEIGDVVNVSGLEHLGDAVVDIITWTAYGKQSDITVIFDDGYEEAFDRSQLNWRGK